MKQVRVDRDLLIMVIHSQQDSLKWSSVLLESQIYLDKLKKNFFWEPKIADL